MNFLRPRITQRAEKKGREFVGPTVWSTIHSFAAGYTPDKAECFKKFITCTFMLFPCDECRGHAFENLRTLPLDNYLANNHDLFYWTYIFHDTVNQQWNKRNPDKPMKISPNYDDIKNYYFSALESDCSACRR